MSDNRTRTSCPKSRLVRISDVHCTRKRISVHIELEIVFPVLRFFHRAIQNGDLRENFTFIIFLYVAFTFSSAHFDCSPRKLFFLLFVFYKHNCAQIWKFSLHPPHSGKYQLVLCNYCIQLVMVILVPFDI